MSHEQGPYGPQILRLDVGYGTARKVAGGCLTGCLFALFALVFIMVGGVAAGSSGADGLVVFGAILGGSIALLLGVLLLGIFRTAAWLRGTTLYVRGAFSTRCVDLATAQVWIDSIAETTTVGGPEGMTATVPTGRRIPQLNARDVATGRRVRLRLRGAEGTLLPPHQLHALATTILSGQRPEPDAQHAQWIAHGLYGLAANPFGGHL